MYNHNVDMKTLNDKQLEALENVVENINNIFKSKGLDGFVEVVKEDNGFVDLIFTSRDLEIMWQLLNETEGKLK